MNATTYGMIEPSLDNIYGFTPDRFSGYLWQEDDLVYISFIVSRHPGQGHFRALVERILQAGLTVKVAKPFPNMERILAKNEFTKTEEYSPEMAESVEVWVRRP